MKLTLTVSLSGDIIELLIYHQPGVKPSLTLHPFGILGYVAGHSLTGAPWGDLEGHMKPMQRCLSINSLREPMYFRLGKGVHWTNWRRSSVFKVDFQIIGMMWG